MRARNQRRIDLADSWLESPINDIFVRDGDYAIADGNERVAGILLRGVPEITITLLPSSTPDSQLDEISLLTDFHKTTLKPIERARLAKRLLDSTGAKKGEIATRLRIDAGYLTKLLSLFDCPIEVQQAAEVQLGVDDWYACSRSPDPLETLRIKLSGANKQQIQRSARKSKSTAPAVRASSIRCPLITGHTITIKGEELSLDEAIDSLKEAVKAMTKARDQGLDAKTFQAVMKDMAAAAG